MSVHAPRLFYDINSRGDGHFTTTIFPMLEKIGSQLDAPLVLSILAPQHPHYVLFFPSSCNSHQTADPLSVVGIPPAGKAPQLPIVCVSLADFFENLALS